MKYINYTTEVETFSQLKFHKFCKWRGIYKSWIHESSPGTIIQFTVKVDPSLFTVQPTIAHCSIRLFIVRRVLWNGCYVLTWSKRNRVLQRQQPHEHASCPIVTHTGVKHTQKSCNFFICKSFNFYSITLHSIEAPSPTTQLRFYNSTTQLPHNNRRVPRGTTVLLECRVTPHQQQTYYKWTCPHPPCDGEYRKVYNNLILIVATATTSGRYKCTPNPHGNEVSSTLNV